MVKTIVTIGILVVLIAAIAPSGISHGLPAMPGMMGRNPDIADEGDFLIQMIPHHEEAIAAAAILRDHADREALKEFARDIIATQSEEIERMESYLETWYPDRNYDVPYTPMMRDLDGLSGEELERAFLEDMISHHMGAVMMAQQLLARGLVRHEEVASLATSIRDNQRAEIAQMQSWISQWYGPVRMGGRRDGSVMMWNGWSGWFFPVMLIGSIGVVGLIVLAVWLLGRSLSSSTNAPTTSKTARELLDMRYAKGEISREE